MKNKRLYSLAISLLGLAALSACWLVIPGYTTKEAETPPPSRPNIVFIISDDHTSQAISAYGSKLAKTPNIDRIAREGAILYNNVVANSICGPSRATLLTGQFSHRNGYKFNEKVFDINQPVFPKNCRRMATKPPGLGKCTWGACPMASTT